MSNQSRNGVVAVKRVMTADVAQGVDALRDGLLAVDKLDDLVAGARSREEMARYQELRRTAHAELRKRRAELDAVLLGTGE